jgi:hypothetical protein
MAETSYIIQNGRRLNLRDATARKSIGSCSELETETKHCLVMAINELNEKVAKGGGGAGGGGVESFNGRTGAVVPAAGDYTADMVGARPDTWMPAASDVGAAASDLSNVSNAVMKAKVEASGFVSGGGSDEVYISDTEPTDEGATIWIDTSEAGDSEAYYTKGETDEKFAPAGHGLGENEPQRVSSWDEAIRNGWYKAPVPEGFGAGVIWGFVSNLDSTYIAQTIYIDTFPNCSATRMRINGTWTPWEWVNPPMLDGVEYRTTQRFAGKAIYTKAVGVGYVAAGTHTFAHNVTNMDVPYSLEVLNLGGWGITNAAGNSQHFDRTNIQFATGANQGSISFVLKYTKF